MAKETLSPEQASQPPQPPAAPKGVTPMKLAIIGIPVFLVQLAVVYFLVAKFIAPSSPPSQAEPAKAAETKESTDQPKSTAPTGRKTLKKRRFRSATCSTRS